MLIRLIRGYFSHLTLRHLTFGWFFFNHKVHKVLHKGRKQINYELWIISYECLELTYLHSTLRHWTFDIFFYHKKAYKKNKRNKVLPQMRRFFFNHKVHKVLHKGRKQINYELWIISYECLELTYLHSTLRHWTFDIFFYHKRHIRKTKETKFYRRWADFF